MINKASLHAILNFGIIINYNHFLQTMIKEEKKPQKKQHFNSTYIQTVQGQQLQLMFLVKLFHEIPTKHIVGWRVLTKQFFFK